MTSLTGSTAAKLKGSGQPPGFWVTMGGSFAQLGAMALVWDRYAGASVSEYKRGVTACGLDFSVSGCRDWSFSAPWTVAVLAQIVLAFAIWLSSVVKRGHDGLPDPSVVDKLWSVTPFVNAWWFHWTTITPQRPYGSPRTLCMALLATTWGMRLTWNFWRKGGYIPGSEDYRWVEVRKWMPGMQFEVFNVVFICLFQPLLLMALAAPAAVAAAHSDVPLNQSDVAAAVLFSMLLCGETVADLQMFDYQTEKYRRKGNKEPLGPYARGFIETGLWAWSRHPNYLCEVHIWFAYYLFSVGAGEDPVNWTLLGPVLLALLFVSPGASLDVTEMLSSKKYRDFPEYQARVPKFYPIKLW
eukprot:m.463250 g.463250  ORF g.463250 m.463250 type:complete len:355 (+) comp22971_c0_seq1:17-1081(+)